MFEQVECPYLGKRPSTAKRDSPSLDLVSIAVCFGHEARHVKNPAHSTG